MRAVVLSPTRHEQKYMAPVASDSHHKPQGNLLGTKPARQKWAREMENGCTSDGSVESLTKQP